MNDTRIKELTDDVLAQLQGAGGAAAQSDLEARVATLERAVRALEAGLPATTAAAIVVTRPEPHAHPSLRVLDVAGGSDRCVLEPDKPCIQSGQCRRFGH